MIRFNSEQLDEILDFYNSGILAWHDKGEEAEKDIPLLIEYIRHLENKVEMLDRYIKSEF